MTIPASPIGEEKKQKQKQDKEAGSYDGTDCPDSKLEGGRWERGLKTTQVYQPLQFS